MSGVVVERRAGGCGLICARILATLPEWFGLPEANQRYAEAADELPTMVASASGEPIGLLTIVRHAPETAEIHLIAVARSARGRGIGRALVHAAEDHLRADGVRFLQAKTLSSRSPDAGYAETRAFYDAMGFVVFEEMPELWDPSNPAVVLVKAL